MSDRPDQLREGNGKAPARRDGPPRDEVPGRPRMEIVDLSTVTGIVTAEAGRGASERAARSLFQASRLGAVLTALQAGASVHNDQPDEAATIQGIQGECQVSLDGRDALLSPGTLIGLPPRVTWRLVARTDAVILLTVATG